MDGYEGKEFHGFPTRYKALWLCDICGHLVMVSRDGSNESKVGGDHNNPPLGSFPDDTPCPKCNTRCLLPSHGDIGIECPRCGWYKTIKECLAEKVGGEKE